MEKIIQFEKDASRYCALARARADSGDFEGALSFLFSAVSIGGADLDVYADIADCYADMGLLELSNKYWFLYMDNAPKQKVSVAYEELAINYFYLDNYWASSYYFNKKLNTDGVISKEGLSPEIIDFFSGEERRRESYKIVYPPERADFTYEKSKAKRSIAVGMFEEADRILSNIPKECFDEETFGDLAVCRFMNDNLDEAEQACRSSLKLFGDNVTAFCNLSTIYDMRKDFEKSDYYYRKAISCKKGTKDEAYKIATCAIEREDHLTVLQTIDEILKDRPYEVSMRFFYALAKVNTGDAEGGLNEIKRAVAIDPSDIVIKYYYEYFRKMVSGEGDYLNLTPFKYVKALPEKVEDAWKKKVEALVKQPSKIESTIKKPEWMDILTFGLYSNDSEFMRSSVFLLSSSKSRFAKNLLRSALLESESREELKRVIVYVLIIDGVKEKFGVVYGSFYQKIRPRHVACEKDLEKGALFTSAYALCVSKCLVLDLEEIDKIGRACNKVYRKLKDKVSDAEVSNEDLAALMLSECKFGRFSEDVFVLRMFSVTKNKLKTLKKMMEGKKDD